MPQVIGNKQKWKEAIEGLELFRRLAKQVVSQKGLHRPNDWWAKWIVASLYGNLRDNFRVPVIRAPPFKLSSGPMAARR